QALLRLASDAELTRTGEGLTYARVPVADHHEFHEIRSLGFKLWLTREFFQEQGRPPATDAMQGALGVLDARARLEGAMAPVHVRVAPGGGGVVHIDLGDESWRVVEVSPEGWELVSRPCVRFRRPRGMRALPTPEPGGAILLLRQFANVAESDFPLLV